ncbi:hypothetical protein LCGC14_1303850 [marine sediment metagenome]|uniref:Uncharacterized protein n=1 Tax=marine sediment metagenome TaxID=412755 RepID=A0A0F9L9A6_9ZZZZ
MILAIAMYFVVGCVWCSYAVSQQVRHFGVPGMRIVVCAILNIAIWPIAMVCAIAKDWR